MFYLYNWLQSFFEKKIPPPEKLAGILTLHFAEVEDVHPVKSLQGKFNGVKKAAQEGEPRQGREGNYFVLDIDVRPNRASDCFSHEGIAREIAAILNLKLKLPDAKCKEVQDVRTKDFITVEVKDKAVCLRYTARVITDIQVGPSPKWLQEKLAACGLRPINNVVDSTNYVMLESGQPLHAFDAEKIFGKKIIVRLAKKGERITALDGEKYDLDENILLIADEKKPLALAGIKGGKAPEIDERTKNVILESANFNSRIVRRASRQLNLKTDASLRFEHGLDPNLTEYGVNRASSLIQQIAGGKIVQGMADFYPKKIIPKKINLQLDYVESLLGVKIPEKEIISILERLGFKISLKTKKSLNVKVPTRRQDVSLPEDLIEEIGRIKGYEKIEARFPVSSLIPPKRNLDIFWENKTKNVLKEAGIFEACNYSFVAKKDIALFGLDPKELIALESPLSSDYEFLRPSLIPNLLKNIQKNQDYFEEIRIFELGKVFGRKVQEQRMLSGLVSRGGLREEIFYEVKGVTDRLLNALGMGDVRYEEYKVSGQEKKTAWRHAKKCAEIKAGGERIGFVGEISSLAQDALKIKSKIVYFDIFFEKLVKLASESREYRPISKFPTASRDLALLVPLQTKTEDVSSAIKAAGGPLVNDVDLFDVYEGKELPQGKKNLAFRIAFQAEDKTLSFKEIEELQDKISSALEKNPDWQVRR